MDIEYVITNQERLLKAVEKGINNRITYDYANLILNVLNFQQAENNKLKADLLEMTKENQQLKKALNIPNNPLQK